MTEQPTLPPLKSTLTRAQTYLDERAGDYRVVEGAALPNPLQGLWIVSYESANAAPSDGGGLAVTADEVREIPSTLEAEEYIGALQPEDEEIVEDDAEIEAVLATWGDEVEIESILEQFGGFDPSQPRAKDGKWNPGGGNDGKEDDKPKSDAEKERNLVKGILKALDDVLDQLTSRQAKALIERIKDNAHSFIQGQSRAAGGGGGGKGGKKGGDDGGKAKDGKKGGDDGGGGGGKKDDGGLPGGLQGVIRGVTNLIESYGNNMKPDDRAKLQESVDKLKELS